MTTPQNHGLEWATAGPAAMCPRRGTQGGSRAEQVSGTITQVATSGGGPSAVDADVMVSFPAGNDAGAPSTERLNVHNLNVTPACVE